MEVHCLPLEAPLLFDLLLQMQHTRIMMATMMANAMHPPMIPHNAPSERPDPRAPVEGASFLSSVVVFVDSVVGEVAAGQN